MDRPLRPKVFETESTEPNAEKLYKHWKMTRENYIEENLTPVTPGTDEATRTAAEAATASNNNKKTFLLHDAKPCAIRVFRWTSWIVE